jgi:hypothetical protein
MQLESKKVTVSTNPQEVFTFLTNLKNFEQLMPKEKIEEFTATPQNCSFKIKGMTTIGMQLENTEPFTKIHILPFQKNPIDFDLTIYLDEIGMNQTQVYFIFKGNVNPMMELMVKNPLTNFFNILADNLTKVKF